jgi:thioredoxin
MDYEKNTEVWQFEGDLPCIVDFYATWCPPCKVSDPILETLAEEYSGKIRIYKVDVDQEEELAAVFGIQTIPTFLFCPLDGNPTISKGIAQTPEETEALFRQQIEELLFTISEL